MPSPTDITLPVIEDEEPMYCSVVLFCGGAELKLPESRATGVCCHCRNIPHTGECSGH